MHLVVKNTINQLMLKFLKLKIYVSAFVDIFQMENIEHELKFS